MVGRSTLRSNGSDSRFFEPSRLAGLEKMRFTTARRVEGAYSGRHVARSLGGAGEFVDYREYSPGDDLRRLDWKAMGRTGRSYLKLYQDETDLQCSLLLDCSGSMLQGGRGAAKSLSKTASTATVRSGSAAEEPPVVLRGFPRLDRATIDGSGSKLEWCQYFSTALAHLIVLGRDAVGLGVAREGLVEYFPPRASFQQRGVIHSAIAEAQPVGETRLADSLDGLMIQSRRRGVLLILSDFLVDDTESVIASLRKFRAAGWEIIAIHVTHPHEERLPDGHAFRFADMESTAQVNCQLAEVRRAYERRFAEHLQHTRAALVGCGCQYQLVSVSTDYVEVLRSFMVLRSS